MPWVVQKFAVSKREPATLNDCRPPTPQIIPAGGLISAPFLDIVLLLDVVVGVLLLAFLDQ
jgi:hypothetical protein